MTSYFSSLEVLEPRVFESAETDSDEIMVFSTLRLRTRQGGVVWERPLTQVVRVNRGEGVVLEITPFYWDVAGLRRILGM